MVIVFVPIWFILILLFCGVALANEAISSFVDALPFIAAATVVTLLVLGIHLMARFFRSQRPNALSVVSEVVMFLSISVGLFAFAGPMSLDRSHRWLTWFGDGYAAQLLTYIGIILVANAVLLILAFVIPLPVVPSLLMLVSIALPFGLYYNALEVTSKSYSDYIATYFDSMESIREYRVTTASDIHYPDIFKGDTVCPAWFPAKYTNGTFEEGDIVYTVYNTAEYYAERDYTYVVVSDGTKAGKIAIDSLEAVDTPQYTYSLETKSESNDLYEADVRTVTYKRSDAEGSYERWSRTDEILATLGQGEPLTLIEEGVNDLESADGYLQVRLADGTEGYMAIDDIKVVRTPINGDTSE